MNRNTPFTVSADHDGTDTDVYRLYINGAQAQEQPVSALAEKVIAFSHAEGLPRGTYTVEVAASNADGETRSESLSLVVTGAAPSAPVNLRVGIL